jgi:asparagine synthase (glutamine-hydrolysing)
MEHRGPDARGVHLDEGAALGAQRLAIIDRAGGDQPIYNETRDVAVVFNGEIYNHDDLRHELIRRGHRFRSAADTEVLVHLYEDHGPSLVEQLRGMFAFAIWDKADRRLVCGRDRVGEKPLFWARRGTRFVFASELYALLQSEEIERRLEPQAIQAYLALGYVPEPLCAVARVHKLPPACTLVLEHGARERVERYWQLAYIPKHSESSAKDDEARLRSMLDEATRLRLQSEVPLGVMLSGGVDSSAVVALAAQRAAAPIKTFSVGFDDHEHDETAFARRISKHFATDHHELRLHADVAPLMPKMARHYGEPFADSSAVPTFQISEAVSREVTVVLTGDGGDENFAGYGRYVFSKRLAQAERFPPLIGALSARSLRMLGNGRSTRSWRRRLRHFAQLASLDVAGLYAQSLVIFDADARCELVRDGLLNEHAGQASEQMLTQAWDSVRADHPTDHMMGVDIATYLPGDLLVKMDIATMAHSIEARSPFLDHELMEFAAALPVEQKLDGLHRKRILKAALRGLLPDEILDRGKMGFGIPAARWLRNELAELPAELLLDPGSSTRDYVNRGAVERLIREHQEEVVDHSGRIWSLMMLEMWHREILESRPRSDERVHGQTARASGPS